MTDYMRTDCFGRGCNGCEKCIDPEDRSVAQPVKDDGASGSPSSYRARPDGQGLNPDLSASASPATKEQQ